MKTLYWIPRVLGIAAIAFISLFALDAFDGDAPFFEKLLGFGIHLIPSFILLLLLWLAWKKELIGGLIFMGIAVAVSPWLWKHNYAMNQSVAITASIIAAIALPFFVIGLLFVVHYYLAKKKGTTAGL